MNSKTVATNKKARFDFFLEETFVAGLMLEGWEVKSLREGKLNIKEAYICLLYTSPSPRDATLSRMPSSA